MHLRRTPYGDGSGLPCSQTWQESVGCRGDSKVSANQACADGSDYGAFFKTARYRSRSSGQQRAGRIAPSAERDSAVCLPARSHRGRGAMRPGRCLPVMRRRASAENRDAGAPIGGGLDSPRSSNYNGAQPIPARSPEGVSCRRIVSRSPESRFSGRRPRRRGRDVIAPATHRGQRYQRPVANSLTALESIFTFA